MWRHAVASEGMSLTSAPVIVTLTLNPALDVSTAVERVVRQHKLRCEPPRITAGGGGVNVARTVTALGGTAIPVYAVGGLTGERYRLLLHQEGMPGIAVSIGGETRESISIDDRGDGGQYRFVFPGPAMTGEEYRSCLEAVGSRLVPGGYLVVSGSLPAGISGEVYAELVTTAHERGARCAIDASGDALAQAIAAGADLIKPSLRELSEFVGRDLGSTAEQDDAMRQILATSNVTEIALTLGADGAALATHDGVLRLPAFSVTERSTVGAGDAFIAGYVLRRVQGHPANEALRAALAAGAAMVASDRSSAALREWIERVERS